MTTTPAYRCSLCGTALYNTVATGRSAELAFHGNSCEGVSWWWEEQVIQAVSRLPENWRDKYGGYRAQASQN